MLGGKSTHYDNDVAGAAKSWCVVKDLFLFSSGVHLTVPDSLMDRDHFIIGTFHQVLLLVQGHPPAQHVVCLHWSPSRPIEIRMAIRHVS